MESKISSHLAGGRVNVSLFQEAAKRELLDLLHQSQCEGPKVIICDEWLAGPIGLITQFSLLNKHDVVDRFPLKSGIIPPQSVKHVIFVTRPKVELMDHVADLIFACLRNNKNSKREFHLFFVPRKSELCEKHLANRKVLGSLSLIQEFKCDFFPFDSDVMSLELEDDFKEYQLEGDTTCLFSAARALRSIQKQCGTIPKVYGKGQAAKQVLELLYRLNKEDQGLELRGPSQGCIDQLLVLDRTTDLASVLVTQLNYEGLIDEFFGLQNNTAEFPASKFHSSEEQQNAGMSAMEKKRIILNSNDELYKDLRDRNFSTVGVTLSKKAHIIQDQLSERHKNKTIQEMKQYVSRLPQMIASKQSLATQTAIAEYVKEITDTYEFQDALQCEEDFLNCIDTDKASPFILDLIAQQAPLQKVLRLICLQCLTGSGLKPKLLDYYKMELFQVYGLQTWPSLCNLEKCGLLKAHSGSRQYAVLRKALRLTTSDDTGEDREKSYLSSVYTPITIRLAESISKNKTLTGLHDVLGLLPGPTIEEIQILPPGQNRRNSLSSESSADYSKVTLVFFIGGCTYNEISALRNLSLQENNEFVILTTKLINGNTLIESLMAK